MIYLGHIKYMNHVIAEELEETRLCRAAAEEKCRCVSQGVLAMDGGVAVWTQKRFVSAQLTLLNRCSETKQHQQDHVFFWLSANSMRPGPKPTINFFFVCIQRLIYLIRLCHRALTLIAVNTDAVIILYFESVSHMSPCCWKYALEHQMCLICRWRLYYCLSDFWHCSDQLL